ncbi:MAG: hypothetical protein HXY40_19820 [Chloroflexi bacterium]|nr:hypothetical protein [Chloroflexota bacterium]
MPAELLRMMLDGGLLQFGRFEKQGEIVPLVLALDLLPAYPEILRALIDEGAKLVGGWPERLLCTADAVPFAVGLSLQIGIPLVYSRGHPEQPVHDLVGAYDVGHPTLLITQTLAPTAKLEQFINQAKKVGLDVQGVLAITDGGASKGVFHDKPHGAQALIALRDMVDQLEAEKALASGQAQAVRDWMGLTL